MKIEVRQIGKAWLATSGNVSCMGRTREDAIKKLKEFFEQLGLEGEDVPSEQETKTDTAKKEMLEALHSVSDSLYEAYQRNEITEADLKFLSEQPKDPQ